MNTHRKEFIESTIEGNDGLFHLKQFVRSRKPFDQQSFDNFVDRANGTESITDIEGIAKQFGSLQSGKAYVGNLLIHKINQYLLPKSSVAKELDLLAIKPFIEKLYPEIVGKNYDIMDYITARADFMNQEYLPVYKKNTEIGKEYVRIKKLVHDVKLSNKEDLGFVSEVISKHLTYSKGYMIFHSENELDDFLKEKGVSYAEVKNKLKKFRTTLTKIPVSSKIYGEKPVIASVNVATLGNVGTHEDVVVPTTGEQYVIDAMEHMRTHRTATTKTLMLINMDYRSISLFLSGVMNSSGFILEFDCTQEKPPYKRYPKFTYSPSQKEIVSAENPIENKDVSDVTTDNPDLLSKEQVLLTDDKNKISKQGIIEKDVASFKQKGEYIQEREGVPNMFVVYVRKNNQLRPTYIMNTVGERIPYSRRPKFPQGFQYPEKND